jgi:hypothetical protein
MEIVHCVKNNTSTLDKFEPESASKLGFKVV